MTTRDRGHELFTRVLALHGSFPGRQRIVPDEYEKISISTDDVNLEPTVIDLRDPLCHDFECPYCACGLESGEWYMPGMRKLSEYTCSECGREFYGDLPAGFGLYYPMLLERETGTVHDNYGIDWYARLLEDSFEKRDSTLQFEVERTADVDRAVLLNCLDVNYGHSLNKLLHAEYYLRETDLDPIVVVPGIFRWMVPDAIPEVWSVDVGLSEGGTWDDGLATEIRNRVDTLEACYLDLGQELRKSSFEFSVERFTGAKPFPLDAWDERPPSVTFIWRESSSGGSTRRFWCSLPDETTPLWRSVLASPRSEIRGIVNLLGEKYDRPALSMREQARNIERTARTLRQRVPGVDVAIAGVGTTGSFPEWMTDIRYDAPDDREERELCERYANSHVVVGIHGSHMSLPSIHAGAVVELVQDHKWKQYSGDIGFRTANLVDEFLRYRMIPAATPPRRVATIVGHLLQNLPKNRKLNRPKYEMDDDDILALQSSWRGAPFDPTRE